ncbi:PQQ-dependent sugar dehydrogenase [Streptomyces sp. MP131-18]|uniref:PQQ-dependent sugar dehydrogenase n=1 Tax=Streptomyces sp. MP131-18 TaxID=1857892 RepID=UPI00097CAC78|nr:PQQ-dependent sugar dehydrogenase [Streptomyces sp. MP131-18]ONK11351.1 Soluble aldose sugar dehydrogenase YliI precursor [Streptomyces sp. MP131-18]
MHRRTRKVFAALTGSVLAIAGTITLATTQSTAAAAPGEDPAPTAEFQQVTLAKGEPEMGEPMSLAVLPDRSVLHTARDGTVRITDANGTTSVAGTLDVYAHDEEGLQGVGVDPDFENNRFVYLYYAPPLDTPGGDAPGEGAAGDFAPFDGVNRLSRFVLNESNQLDLGTETRILDVPASRGQCCHVGGDIDFDAEGNLYLSTGDDTNPFASDGYTPIDERADRNPAFDAQRSSANTNDLRGKVLRITVNDDGSYSVPEGNLFAEGTEGTRPEIYAMGFRNPFRMSVDQETGIVYVGDYGPDAGTASDSRGPGGQVEFNRITAPGNFGWPYCTGDNDAYVDYDFGSGASGATFDCNAPVNESPHNTGLTELPPAQPAWIPYDGDSVPEFGNGSESPMAGPVYHYDPDLESSVKFPEEYDGNFFATEYGRRWIRAIDLQADGTVNSISEFPWSGTQVMDSAFGPDGALYVLDYGTGYFNGDENSALYRIENVTGGRSPIAEASGTPTSGPAPLAVTFSAEGSNDPDGDEISYSWDFGDGNTSTEPNPSHTYEEDGTYTAELTVTDAGGLTGSASVPINVGNTAPTVELILPADGQLVDFGDAVPFEIEVSDPEDGEIDCSQVTLSFVLGHDSHGHKLTDTTGCSGTIQTLADGEHDPNANIFGIFDAEYTDAGGLTTHDQVTTQTRTRQAEHFGDSSGVEITEYATAHGGRAVGFVDNGDWISFTPYLLADATEFTARVASGGAGGTIEVRADSPTGTVLGSVDVAPTGGWDVYQDVTTSLTDLPAGTTTLHLVFTGPTGGGGLFDIDDFTFGTGSQ